MLGADAKSLPGITQPFPQLFDPFNLLGNAAGTKDGVNEVKRWREAELTHGRVAMLAALGFVTQEQILGANAPRPFPHVSGELVPHAHTLLGYCTRSSYEHAPMKLISLAHGLSILCLERMNNLWQGPVRFQIQNSYLVF